MILGAPAQQHRCRTSGISSESEQHLWTSRCRQRRPCPLQCGPQTAALPHRPALARRSSAAGTQRQRTLSALGSSAPQPRPSSARSGPCSRSRRAAMSPAAAQAGNNGGSAAGASGQDLLVVGPGVLGSYVGRLWLEAFPGGTVVGQTNTTSSHERWARCIGVMLRDGRNVQG